jgi:hypothetical protein
MRKSQESVRGKFLLVEGGKVFTPSGDPCCLKSLLWYLKKSLRTYQGSMYRSENTIPRSFYPHNFNFSHYFFIFLLIPSHFPLLYLPLFIFLPQTTSADIFPQGGGIYFQIFIHQHMYICTVPTSDFVIK